MAVPFAAPAETMEARTRATLPAGGGWAYEPKWDGFRCHAWGPGATGEEVALFSRSQRPLRRYFPELDAALEALPDDTVVDGEVCVVAGGALHFDALQLRVHPAESRIAKLSREIPAWLIAFDLLADRGEDVRDRPFTERRARLQAIMAPLAPPWHLTPSTDDVDVAQRWFTEFESAGCDGIVAKQLAGPYRAGERAMIKVKHRREADCVIGGYRLHKDGDKVGSLLLGLYDAREQLHFIGHCSGFRDADRTRLLADLQELVDGTGAGGGFGADVRRPGAPSRWTGDKDLSWVPLRPELVCRVSYDQLTGERFRHATRFEGWRPDVDPASCTLAQLERPEGPTVQQILA